MTEEKKGIIEVEPTQVTQQTQQLAPLTPDAAKEMMEMYQAYIHALLKPEDYQKIQGKEFKKKSAWRKLAMANNLSVRVVSERREELTNSVEEGDYAYHFVCEATHPNGRVTSGSGSCTKFEKSHENSLHNVRSTAETRAWNRAVSNMIAAGEVSAEEADQENHSTQYQNPTPKPQQALKKPVNNDGIPPCPVCDGQMWDNRDRKASGEYKPTSPDFSCQDANCKNEKGFRTGVWLEKEETINIEDIPF